MPPESANPDEDDCVDAAATLVGDAERITVLTGAGISTDSGIPDFRGPNGVWTRDPEAEKTSDITYYLRDEQVRRRAWQGRVAWFEAAPVPNPGHHALVDLERAGRLRTLVTQNIDGLHHAAGNSAEVIVEVHGTIREVVCLGCGTRGPMEPLLGRVRSGEEDPRCLDCEGLLKSATVSFGQNLDPADLKAAFIAAADCDLFLAVGTSLAVYPIADTVGVALDAGARVVICNAQETPYDAAADVVVRGSLSEVLPRIVGGS